MRKANEILALTGLRGVAALWVIGYHCNLWLPTHFLPTFPFDWGFLGVDIFFILSGFLLYSIHPKIAGSDWRKFMLKRCFRIYPLHVCIMAILGVLVLLASLRGLHLGEYYAPEKFPAVLSLSHVYVGMSGWNDPSWSVSVEMLCYALLPFCAQPLQRLNGGVVWILIVLLLTLDASIIVASAHTNHAMLDHAMLDHAMVDHAMSVTDIIGLPPLMRGLLGFTVGGLLSRHVRLDSIATARILTPLAWAPIYRLGQISFSMYLIHAPILSCVKRLDPILARMHMSALELPAVLVSIILLSLLTYRWIELPGQNAGARLLHAMRQSPIAAASGPNIGHAPAVDLQSAGR